MNRTGRKREQLRQRDGDACFYCGEPMRFIPPKNPRAPGARRLMASVEHLVDLKHGGTWALNNLVLAHEVCNNSRNYMSLDEKLDSRGMGWRECPDCGVAWGMHRVDCPQVPYRPRRTASI